MQILHVFRENFADFFGISQNFNDFDRSDAKIAIFQISVKKKIAEILLQIL